MKETIKISSKLIVALVFIFSGFVKCVDPTGTAIKMEEYLIAFHMDFLVPLSMLASVAMCGAELLVGIMLLFNLKIKWAIWGAIAMMLFYTPLTLWLAISNKVGDCGCFGDAIKLTNWQTFLKNVVLDVILVFIYLNRNHYKNKLKQVIQVGASGVLAILVIGFEIFNLNHLPAIDFMPYKTGNNIPAGMIVPPGAPKEVRSPIVLYYEKAGKTEKFSLQNYPGNDSTWRYVKTESKVLKKGYEPPIHDFIITTPDGQEITDLILSDEVPSLLIVFHTLNKTSLKNIGEINRLADQAVSKGYKVYGLTSSLPEEFEVFKEKARATYPLYNMDGTTLKTMIRSNPGVILLKKGTIMGKWNAKQLKKLKSI